jgi:hypothetical protein
LVNGPPPDDAVHVTRTVFAAVICTVGVPGAPGAPGMIDADLATDGVLPAGPIAVTRNVYDFVASKPLKTQVSELVLAQPSGGSTAGSDETE